MLFARPPSLSINLSQHQLLKPNNVESEVIWGVYGLHIRATGAIVIRWANARKGLMLCAYTIYGCCLAAILVCGVH